MRHKSIRAFAGYFLAGVVLLILLLYLRFPGEAVRDYMKALTAARYPRLLVSIDAIHPSFPPGIAFTNVTTALRVRPEGTLHAGRLRVRPGGLALLQGRLSLILAAEGYGGEIRAQIDYSRRFSVEGPLSAEANLREIRIEKCAWLRQMLARSITGTLRGTVTFSGSSEVLQNGTGNVDIALTNGVYPLMESILGFDRIDFSRVEAKATFRNGALRITRLALVGEKVRCTLKGNVLFADDIAESQLDLDGTLEFPGQGGKRVTLAIGGTLGNPKTKFL